MKLVYLVGVQKLMNDLGTIWSWLWCAGQNTALAQSIYIQEYDLISSIIRQWSWPALPQYTGASRHGNEDVELEVQSNAV